MRLSEVVELLGMSEIRDARGWRASASSRACQKPPAGTDGLLKANKDVVGTQEWYLAFEANIGRVDDAGKSSYLLPRTT